MRIVGIGKTKADERGNHDGLVKKEKTTGV